MSSENIAVVSDDQILDIIEDEAADRNPAQGAQSCWRILIVDDDAEVHAATRYALGQNPIVGRSLELLSAYSAAEGKVILDQNPDVAVVLLDVVMEEHDAGLKFAEWMRARGYNKQRIILRTGQPGYAPELDVVRNYDINDYRAKGELTQTRLITAITAALRTFEQFRIVDEHRASLVQFSYALSHDFKQTTRQILVFSDQISGFFEEEDGTGVRQAAHYLGGAARRLGALVDVMAQYTLMTRSPDMEDVDLEIVMTDVRSAVNPVLRQTGGELIVVCAGKCRSNAALLGHVLQILIANGLQHNESDRPRVEVTAGREAGRCVIAVRDNGVGIEPEYLDEIFKPHMRLRASSELPGTGLGLTLSERAVRSLGGAIRCESELGVGSVFEIDLPAVA